MSGYAKDVLHQSYLDYFKIVRGNLVKQYKSKYYENEDGNFNIVNDWITFGKAIDCSGRLIGGCIDVLKDIIGTKYDKTLSFIEKYKYDRIIWYFDVYSLESEVLYRTLLQFKDAGWFKYTDLIVIGKVCVPSSETGFTYEEAVNKALSEYKVIYKFDVGHVKPSMTMINGMKAHIVSNDKENYIEYI
jgi:muramoyltetrapeptide carboxypeptidase LdcA involved in peptidoglycan recycling